MNLALNSITFYILIVDDNESDHFFLRRAINKIVPQAIIESFYNGTEALNFLDTCTSMPSIIFMDLNMPRLTGIEAVKVIRKNESLAKTPVIILTSSASPSKRVEALNTGANDFYTKPLDPGGLFEIVENVANRWLV